MKRANKKASGSAERRRRMKKLKTRLRRRRLKKAKCRLNPYSLSSATTLLKAVRSLALTSTQPIKIWWLWDTVSTTSTALMIPS
jgi:hypothetical protein